MGIKTATIAVLFTNADAIAIENKYTISPIAFDFEPILISLKTTYSNTPDFCNEKLNINNADMVITAGLEKPDIASFGDINPIIIKIPKMNSAVTSIGKVSVTNRTNASPIMNNTMAISTVISDNLRIFILNTNY